MGYGFFLASPTRNVTSLLIAIIAIYLFFAIFGRTHFAYLAYDALVLDPERTIYKFQLWRLITYGFLHDATSPMHVIFNALLLYMVGPQLEDRWGAGRFLIFILSAILLGGLMVCVSFLLGLSAGWVIGFSAAGLALIIAWGMIFSHQHIFIFGILPLTGQQLVYATCGLEVIYAVSSNSISSAAHFGGILAGFIFTLGLYKPRRIHDLWRGTKSKRGFRR